MEHILSDTTKFTQLDATADPYKLSLKLEDKINRKLRNLKANSNISDGLYNELYCTGTSVGTLYGLPKIHKDGCPLRPILAAYNCHNFKLAKFIDKYLKEFSTDEHTVENSYNFTEDITLQDSNKFMVTNVHLDEVINISSDLYKNSGNKDFEPIILKKLLKLAVLDTHFMFNNKIYQQKDGISMGSPLGPTLANIF